MPQRLQLPGGAADPVGERGTVERYAVGRQHLRLTVERQMPMVLCINDMRDKPLGRQSSLDQSFRHGVLKDGAMATQRDQNESLFSFPAMSL